MNQCWSAGHLKLARRYENSTECRPCRGLFCRNPLECSLPLRQRRQRLNIERSCPRIACLTSDIHWIAPMFLEKNSAILSQLHTRRVNNMRDCECQYQHVQVIQLSSRTKRALQWYITGCYSPLVGLFLH